MVTNPCQKIAFWTCYLLEGLTSGECLRYQWLLLCGTLGHTLKNRWGCLLSPAFVFEISTFNRKTRHSIKSPELKTRVATIRGYDTLACQCLNWRILPKNDLVCGWGRMIFAECSQYNILMIFPNFFTRSVTNPNLSSITLQNLRLSSTSY